MSVQIHVNDSHLSTNPLLHQSFIIALFFPAWHHATLSVLVTMSSETLASDSWTENDLVSLLSSWRALPSSPDGPLFLLQGAHLPWRPPHCDCWLSNISFSQRKPSLFTLHSFDSLDFKNKHLRIGHSQYCPQAFLMVTSWSRSFSTRGMGRASLQATMSAHVLLSP